MQIITKQQARQFILAKQGLIGSYRRQVRWAYRSSTGSKRTCTHCKGALVGTGYPRDKES